MGELELQPGQVNWSGVPVLLYPGAVRLWLWTAFAHGAEFVTTYRFRQPNFGIELFHHGLMQPDGVTMSEGGKQFVQVIGELEGAPGARGEGQGARSKPETETRIPNPDLPLAPRRLPLQLAFSSTSISSGISRRFPRRKWDQPKWLQMWYARWRDWDCRSK